MVHTMACHYVQSHGWFTRDDVFSVARSRTSTRAQTAQTMRNSVFELVVFDRFELNDTRTVTQIDRKLTASSIGGERTKKKTNIFAVESNPIA